MLAGSLLGLRYARLVLDNDQTADYEALKRRNSYLYVIAYRRLGLPGFQVLEKKTPIIDLTRSLEVIFRGFNATTRNEISKTERMADLKVAVPDPNVEEGYKLYRWAKRKDGVIPEVKQEITNCAQFNAYLRDRMIVSMTCYAEKPILRLKTIASLRKDETTDPRVVGYASRRLVWEMCKYGKYNSYRALDLGIINVDDPSKEGVARFKSGFGGDILETYIYRYETTAFRLLRRLCALTRICQVH